MAQCASMFSQILTLFPRDVFNDVVRKHQADKHSKGFTPAFAGAGSAGINSSQCCYASSPKPNPCAKHAPVKTGDCGGLACCLGKLKHLGVQNVPKKSTLSYANEHRPW